MKFGRIPIALAEGAILAHSLQTADGVLKKGRVLSVRDVEKLKRAGYHDVVAARLAPADVGEDDGAHQVARALGGQAVRVAEPFTGRCNIYAQAPGVLTFQPDIITTINRIDEALTIATLPPFERVGAGQMLVTVKVIPFSMRRTTLTQAVELADRAELSVAPFATKRAGLILTQLVNTKESLLKKREQVMADRLVSLGSELAVTLCVPHETEAVRDAIVSLQQRGCDLVMVFAASAIVDRNDVIPAAVVEAGGAIEHLGMPVDPGNLLMMGRLGEVDVIGVPSCAGSPKLNGFDWVLERRLAGLPVGPDQITAMGVGGLLKEIVGRPQPREGAQDSSRREKRIGCVVLAAGRSTRMGARNKLTALAGDKPIVRHVVEAALASRARPVIVVTGHEQQQVAACLGDIGVQIVHNPAFAEGMSTSLKAGVAMLPAGLDGVIVALGDMPAVTAAHFDRMIAAFEPKEGRSIVVPVHQGRRGNPVLWSSAYFTDIQALVGDVGARSILADNAESVVELDLNSSAIFVDVDTPEALAAVQRGDDSR